MKRNLKERFEDRSFLFMMAMIIGLNMFVLTLGSVIYFFLIGYVYLSLILLIVSILLFVIPYAITYKVRGELRRLSDTLLDNVFLAGFTFSSTIVGIIVLIINMFIEVPGS